MSYFAAIHTSVALRIVSLILLGIATCIVSFITLQIIFSKIPDFPSIGELVSLKINNYFENINQIYLKRGFWWRIAPETLYIEMRIIEKEPEPTLQKHKKKKGEPSVDFDLKQNKSKVLDMEKVKRANSPSFRNSARKNSKNSSRSKSKRSAKVAPINTNFSDAGKQYPKSPTDGVNSKTLQYVPVNIMNKTVNDMNSKTMKVEPKTNQEILSKKETQQKMNNTRIDYYNDNNHVYVGQTANANQNSHQYNSQGVNFSTLFDF